MQRRTSTDISAVRENNAFYATHLHDLEKTTGANREERAEKNRTLKAEN